MSDMEQEEKDMFLADLGLTESGLNRIIKHFLILDEPTNQLDIAMTEWLE